MGSFLGNTSGAVDKCIYTTGGKGVCVWAGETERKLEICEERGACRAI